MAAFLIITIIVFYIATLFIDKMVYPKMYAETSINPFNFFQKLLCAVLGISMFAYMAFIDNFEFLAVLPIILIDLVLIGLLALLNLKYKKPALIVKATIVHTIYGIAFSVRFLFWILMLAFKLFGHTTDSLPVLFGYRASQQSMAEAADEAEKERNNEAAEVYAQSQGFSSADEAEDYGVKTGKKD